MQTLDDCRTELDKIDTKIVELLNDRMSVVAMVGEIKRKQGISPFQKHREIELVEKVRRKAKNPVLRDYIPELYDTIFASSKLSQKIQNGMMLPYRKIGIIGLGLMGGSIAKAVKAADPKTKVYALSGKKITDAESDSVDEVFTDLPGFLSVCDLVFIATPLRQIAETARQISSAADKNKKIIVVDIGSVKNSIATVFEKLTSENIEFVPSHPMAGADKSGFKHSRAGLFNNKMWIITPHSKNSKDTVASIREFVSRLGANTELLTPQVHDKRIATVSHLVYLLASYICLYLNDKRPETLKFAGPGLVSTTRTASGSPEMHAEIFKDNSGNILAELNDFLAYISNYKLNEDNVFEFFSAAKNTRDTYIKDEKN